MLVFPYNSESSLSKPNNSCLVEQAMLLECNIFSLYPPPFKWAPVGCPHKILKPGKTTVSK